MEYCRLVDFGEAAAVADLFTEDAQWRGTDLLLEGREEIRAWFVKREGIARRVSRHVFTNVIVEVLSPSEANCLSYMINFRHDREEGDDSSGGHGRAEMARRGAGRLPPHRGRLALLLAQGRAGLHAAAQAAMTDASRRRRR